MIPLLQPNNLRNRYRRYRGAMRAYGWSPDCFRAWFTRTKGDSYGAPRRNSMDSVPFEFKTSTKAPHCLHCVMTPKVQHAPS